MKKSILTLSFVVLALLTAQNTQAQGTAPEAKPLNANEYFDSDIPAVDDSVKDADDGTKCWFIVRRHRHRVYRTWTPVSSSYYIPALEAHVMPMWVRSRGISCVGLMITTHVGPNSIYAGKLARGMVITEIGNRMFRNIREMIDALNDDTLVASSVHGHYRPSLQGNLMTGNAKGLEGVELPEGGNDFHFTRILTKVEIQTGQHKVLDMLKAPVLGVKAADNGGNGVKVTEVVPGLPGQKAGFEPGDVILEINGMKIENEKNYSDAVDVAGSVLKFKVVCGKTGNTLTAEANLDTNVFEEK